MHVHERRKKVPQDISQQNELSCSRINWRVIALQISRADSWSSRTWSLINKTWRRARKGFCKIYFHFICTRPRGRVGGWCLLVTRVAFWSPRAQPAGREKFKWTSSVERDWLMTFQNTFGHRTLIPTAEERRKIYDTATVFRIKLYVELDKQNLVC